jgi:hypothetical protein
MLQLRTAAVSSERRTAVIDLEELRVLKALRLEADEIVAITITVTSGAGE